MASVVTEILQDLLEALRATGKFRLVSLGEAPSATDVPRASVLYEGQESLQPDDSASATWHQLRISVSVHTRSTEAAEAITRSNELCEEAMGALLQDPYRGNRCRDLPVGRATEIGRSQLVRGLKRPEVEVTFDVRCHLETEGES